MDVKWLLLEQFELKELQHTFGKLSQSPVACFVSQAVIFLQELVESEFKIIPYMQHQLIRVCTNI